MFSSSAQLCAALNPLYPRGHLPITGPLLGGGGLLPLADAPRSPAPWHQDPGDKSRVLLGREPCLDLRRWPCPGQHEAWAWPWVGVRSGPWTGGWVKGPHSVSWGGGWQDLRVGRLESWVPGQALLQTRSVTWPQFPQMSKDGLNILESLCEGHQ